MTRIQRLGVTVLALTLIVPEAMAQRRGGAVSSGVRGAAVGSMVGGSEGAAKGAKIGAVTGVTRSAINRENTARTQYQTSAEYQSAQHSNYAEVPPEIVAPTPPGSATPPDGEAIIRRNNKPVLGVTFPADWKLKTGERSISAVSGDGQAYSMFAILEGIADKEGGVKKVKEGLDKYLQGIKYDEPTETKGGAKMITGTGKARQSGIDVVFAAGIFETAPGQLAGAAFVVDKQIEDHYKETVRGICETIRRASDFEEKR